MSAGLVKDVVDKYSRQKWRASRAGDRHGDGQVDKRNKVQGGEGREWDDLTSLCLWKTNKTNNKQRKHNTRNLQSTVAGSSLCLHKG